MALFRVVAALGAAIYGPASSAAAAALVPAERRQSALAIVFGGPTVSTVLGVPLASFLGDAIGWRGASWTIAAACALGAVSLLVFLPNLPAAPAPHTREYIKVLRTPGAVSSVGTTLLVIAGSFSVYGVIGKYLGDRFHLSAGAVSAALLTFGIIGVIMNLVAPRAADRFGAAHVVLSGIAVFGALMALLLVTPHSAVGMIPFLLWPLGLQTILLPQQGRQVTLVPEQPGVILALNASALYLGMSLGSLLASTLYSATGAGPLPAFGLGLIALALVTHVRSLRAAHDR
jgi:DHA1 family inner membrane transport protein